MQPRHIYKINVYKWLQLICLVPLLHGCYDGFPAIVISINSKESNQRYYVADIEKILFKYDYELVLNTSDPTKNNSELNRILNISEDEKIDFYQNKKLTSNHAYISYQSDTSKLKIALYERSYAGFSEDGRGLVEKVKDEIVFYLKNNDIKFEIHE